MEKNEREQKRQIDEMKWKYKMKLEAKDKRIANLEAQLNDEWKKWTAMANKLKQMEEEMKL